VPEAARGVSKHPDYLGQVVIDSRLGMPSLLKEKGSWRLEPAWFLQLTTMCAEPALLVFAESPR